MSGPPGVNTPTATVFDRQLSVQAPPTNESVTCASETSLHPGGMSTLRLQLPKASARLV